MQLQIVRISNEPAPRLEVFAPDKILGRAIDLAAISHQLNFVRRILAKWSVFERAFSSSRSCNAQYRLSF